jgi:hypothetical protein
MSESLSIRRDLLRRHILPTLSEPIRHCPELNAALADVIESVRAAGSEGVVAKRLDSAYEPGSRSGASTVLAGPLNPAGSCADPAGGSARRQTRSGERRSSRWIRAWPGRGGRSRARERVGSTRPAWRTALRPARGSGESRTGRAGRHRGRRGCGGVLQGLRLEQAADEKQRDHCQAGAQVGQDVMTRIRLCAGKWPDTWFCWRPAVYTFT